MMKKGLKKQKDMQKGITLLAPVITEIIIKIQMDNIQQNGKSGD